jgi:hypothetical protein
MFKLLSQSLSQAPYTLYPRIYKVSDIAETENYGFYPEESQLMVKPPCIPASLEKLVLNEAYLIDSGDYIYFFIGN